MAEYTAGEGLRTAIAITDRAGVAVDPTTVTMWYALEGAATTKWTYGGAGAIVKDSVGNYHAVIDTTGMVAVDGPAKLLYVQWQGTGAALVIESAAYMIHGPELA